MKVRLHYENIVQEVLDNPKDGDCLCNGCAKFRIKLAIKNGAKPTASTHGMILLESEPQLRTILTKGVTRTRRIPFPYVIYVVTYQKLNKGYIYKGIYDCGFRFFFRNSPLQNLDDDIFYSPTDSELFGLVCTPHETDNKKFKDLFSLTNTVISMWWELEHTSTFSFANWQNMKAEKALEREWQSAGSLHSCIKNAINLRNSFGMERILCPPEDFPLIDENWTKDFV